MREARVLAENDLPKTGVKANGSEVDNWVPIRSR